MLCQSWINDKGEGNVFPYTHPQAKKNTLRIWSYTEEKKEARYEKRSEQKPPGKQVRRIEFKTIEACLRDRDEWCMRQQRMVYEIAKKDRQNEGWVDKWKKYDDPEMRKLCSC